MIFKKWIYYNDVKKAISDIFSDYFRIVDAEDEETINNLFNVAKSTSLATLLGEKICLYYNDYEIILKNENDQNENGLLRDYMTSRIRSELDYVLLYNIVNNLLLFAKTLNKINVENAFDILSDFITKGKSMNVAKTLTMPNNMASIENGVYDNQNNIDTNFETNTINTNIVKRLNEIALNYTNYFDILINKISYLFNAVMSFNI